MNVRYEVPLRTYHTFGIDATAECLVEYDNVSELQEILADRSYPKPFYPLGGGSNLLFVHSFFKGTLLHSCIKGIKVIEEDEETLLIEAGAGETWDDFVAYTVENGWSGTENLSLIPGSVGASAVQNIGAYGVEAKDIIETVQVVDVESGEIHQITRNECDYAYRQSRFKKEWKGKYIITSVTYRLHKTFTPNLSYGRLSEAFPNLADVTPKAVRIHIIDIRNSKLPDPAVWGNAGSYFMNPVIDDVQYEQLKTRYATMPSYRLNDQSYKIPAAWLIQQAGWKGRQLGNAAVYEHQPLVLINRNNATSQEIVRLADAIIEAVKEKFEITLSPEVIYL